MDQTSERHQDSFFSEAILPGEMYWFCSSAGERNRLRGSTQQWDIMSVWTTTHARKEENGSYYSSKVQPHCYKKKKTLMPSYFCARDPKQWIVMFGQPNIYIWQTLPKHRTLVWALRKSIQHVDLQCYTTLCQKPVLILKYYIDKSRWTTNTQ